jgi:hypothetical protein
MRKPFLSFNLCCNILLYSFFPHNLQGFRLKDFLALKKSCLCYNLRKKKDLIIVAEESTEWIDNLLEKIRRCIESRNFRFSTHAMSRSHGRDLSLPDVIHVLLNGRHEKDKTVFNNARQTWNYAVINPRGQKVTTCLLRHCHIDPPSLSIVLLWTPPSDRSASIWLCLAAHFVIF